MGFGVPWTALLRIEVTPAAKGGIRRGKIVDPVRVTSDGFEFYEKVVRRVLGAVAIYGQGIKIRRIRVERSPKIGTKSQLAAALLGSADS